MQEPHLLYQEIATRLASRLADVEKPFPCALNQSADNGATAAQLQAQNIPEWQEDAPLPLIISNLSLTWANDIHQILLEFGRKLKGDGLLLASLLGAGSFEELENAGLKTNLPPLPDVQDVGTMLSSLKFAMPIVDRDFITLSYPTFDDLKNDCAALNIQLEGQPAAPAPTNLTLEIIYLHAWRPHKSQPKPLSPGSAKVDLSEVL